jgi:hypothetical protein
VDKYLKKRDRKKTAERYRNERKNAPAEKEAHVIFENIQEANMHIDEEIDRQARLVKEKLMHKKASDQIVIDLMEQYHETEIQYCAVFFFFNFSVFDSNQCFTLKSLNTGLNINS